MHSQAIPSNCPILVTLKHGIIKPGICTGNVGNREVPDNTVCSFECKGGYKLMGRKSLTCHGTGRHPKWKVYSYFYAKDVKTFSVNAYFSQN